MRSGSRRADIRFRPWQPKHGRARHQSLWLTSALDLEEDSSPVQLTGDLVADVCIVGGGYTALWTALRLLEAQPSLDVRIVEADLCGSGASGRNNGGVGHLWTALPRLVQRLGDQDGVRLLQHSLKPMSDLKATTAKYGIDCELHQRDSAWAATTSAQVGGWRPLLALADRLGLEAPFRELEMEEVRERFGKGPYFGAAIQTGDSMRIQPAKLARGLKRVVVSLGCTVYEASPVRSITGTDQGVTVRTAAGSVRAEQVLMAANAWMGDLREFNSTTMVVTAGIVTTDPIEHLLEERGLAGRPGGFNAAIRVNTGGLTLDGRVQVGGAGHCVARGNRVPVEFDAMPPALSKIEADFRFLYPELGDVPVTHSWTGAIDRSEAGMPRFGRLASDDRIHYVIGYTGHGVSASTEAGHILAAEILGKQTEWEDVRSLYNRMHQRGFPTEPFRSVASTVIGASLDRVDAAAKQGRRSSWLDRRLSAYANASTPLSGRARSNRR